MKLKLHFNKSTVIEKGGTTIVEETAYVDINEHPLFNVIMRVPFVENILLNSDDYAYYNGFVTFKAKAKCDSDNRKFAYRVAQTQANIIIMKKYRKMISDIMLVLDPLTTTCENLDNAVQETIFKLNDHLKFDLVSHLK